MFNTTTFYISLLRERTAEVIHLELSIALEIINSYNRKQEFMNILGQNNFWKKNRLDLWAALEERSLSDSEKTVLTNVQWLDRVSFVNTPLMLAAIKQKLKNYFEEKIHTTRKQGLSNWDYDDLNSVYNNGKRSLITRAVSCEIPNFYIRSEDIEEFNQDFNKLIKKYEVKDPLRIRSGPRQFWSRTVAQRYVERVYKFKPETRSMFF